MLGYRALCDTPCVDSQKRERLVSLMRPAFRGLVLGLCAGLALGVILTLWLFRDGRWDRVVFFPLLSGMICALSEIREERKRKAKA